MQDCKRSIVTTTKESTGKKKNKINRLDFFGRKMQDNKGDFLSCQRSPTCLSCFFSFDILNKLVNYLFTFGNS
jgi:hypothetical protein